MAEGMQQTRVDADVVICGGGVAGLWLLNRLQQQGYHCLLVESQALGHGQTRHAQGIIHGGTKYALGGAASDSSEAIAAMPALWRSCLAGEGEIDLSAVQLLTDHQLLWSTTRLASRIAGFFASKLMRSRIAPLREEEYPAIFRHADFRGQLYRLEEPVLDIASLIRALAQDHEARIWQGEVLELAAGQLLLARQGKQVRIRAQQIILSAGAGNAGLLQLAGRKTPRMQRRPLKMVMLRGDLPQGVYAHCLGASSNPRLTISSHSCGKGRVTWYLGGELAEQGVRRSNAEQLARARHELQELLPWMDFTQCEFAALDIDRAESHKDDGRRPDDVYAAATGGILTTWPTKLAFAPRLASHCIELLQQQDIRPANSHHALPAWTFPGYAALPWQEESNWS